MELRRCVSSGYKSSPYQVDGKTIAAVWTTTVINGYYICDIPEISELCVKVMTCVIYGEVLTCIHHFFLAIYKIRPQIYLGRHGMWILQ
jgi:hypothetical protein